MDVITITDVTKRFGSFLAIDNLDMSIREGEFRKDHNASSHRRIREADQRNH